MSATAIRFEHDAIRDRLSSIGALLHRSSVEKAHYLDQLEVFDELVVLIRAHLADEISVMRSYFGQEACDAHQNRHILLLVELQYCVSKLNPQHSIAEHQHDFKRFSDMYQTHIDTADAEMLKSFPAEESGGLKCLFN